ncbi:MAG: hypothetical protein P4M09_20550, partial [Devosia sp.]|nr:hypothetical protein [Devosia sp.]
MLHAAQSERGFYFVGGDLIGDSAEVDQRRRLKHANTSLGGLSKPVLCDAPSRLIILDADNLPVNELLPEIDPATFDYADPAQCAALFRAALPPSLQDCRLVLAASGNHGRRGKGARLRGFVMADRPLTKADCEALFAGYLVRDGGSFDPAVFAGGGAVYTRSDFLRNGTPAEDPYPDLRGFVVEGATAFAHVSDGDIAGAMQKRRRPGGAGRNTGFASRSKATAGRASASRLAASFDDALARIGDGPGCLGLHQGLFQAALRAAIDDPDGDQQEVADRLRARMREVRQEIEATGNEARLADWTDRYSGIDETVRGRFAYVQMTTARETAEVNELDVDAALPSLDGADAATLAAEWELDLVFSASDEEDQRILAEANATGVVLAFPDGGKFPPEKPDTIRLELLAAVADEAMETGDDVELRRLLALATPGLQNQFLTQHTQDGEGKHGEPEARALTDGEIFRTLFEHGKLRGWL